MPLYVAFSNHIDWSIIWFHYRCRKQWILKFFVASQTHYLLLKSLMRSVKMFALQNQFSLDTCSTYCSLSLSLCGWYQLNYFVNFLICELQFVTVVCWSIPCHHDEELTFGISAFLLFHTLQYPNDGQFHHCTSFGTRPSWFNSILFLSRVLRNLLSYIRTVFQ